MKTISNRPYLFIWLSIPLALTLSFIQSFWYANSSIDLQVHDTYFVLSIFHVTTVLSLILASIGFMYWIMREKKMINWMTIIHVVVTILALLLLVTWGLVYRETTKLGYHSLNNLNQIQSGILKAVIVCQFLFLLNIGWSIIRNQKL